MEKVGQRLDKAIKYLGYAGAAMGAGSVIVMMLMISLNVTLRYFFNNPLLLVEEFSAYLFIVITYMGLAYTCYVGAHINVDVIYRRFRPRVRYGLDVVTSTAVLVLIGIYLWYAWSLFMESIREGWVAISFIETPMWIPQTFLWLGLGFLVLAIVMRIVKSFIAFQKGPWEEEEKVISAEEVGE